MLKPSLIGSGCIKLLANIIVTKPSLCTYTKYTYVHIHASVYLHFCIRFTNSVKCIRFPMKHCINGENCAGLPCTDVQLYIR